MFSTPCSPLSNEWFDATEQPSYPASTMASASSAGPWKVGYPDRLVLVGLRGTSRWQIARSAALEGRATSENIGRKS